MADDQKVVQFRPRQKPPIKEDINDSSFLSGIIGTVGEKLGLDDTPAQQALRIELGLKGIRDCNPTAAMITEQNVVISNWSDEEKLQRAKTSTARDWQRWPALYTALVMALKAIK